MVVDNPQMPFSFPETEKVSNQSNTKKAKIRPTLATWKNPIPSRQFKLGMIIHSSSTTARHIASITKPLSSCSLSDLAVLNTQEREGESMHLWLKRNRIIEGTKDTAIHWGEQGFQELLESDVDAVYIVVPAE
jgi:hypothetical protein